MGGEGRAATLTLLYRSPQVMCGVKRGSLNYIMISIVYALGTAAI
jgi:hypothetical protein